jgi:hypothetical protein
MLAAVAEFDCEAGIPGWSLCFALRKTVMFGNCVIVLPELLVMFCDAEGDRVDARGSRFVAPLRVESGDIGERGTSLESLYAAPTYILWSCRQ